MKQEVMLEVFPFGSAYGVREEFTISNEVSKKMLRLQADCLELFDAKHTAYGFDNINEIGYEGVLSRIAEKLARLRHMDKTGADGGGESVKDSLQDISNLALIALLYKKGEWK